MSMTEKEKRIAEMLGGSSIISAVNAMDDDNEEAEHNEPTVMTPMSFDLDILEGLNLEEFAKAQMVGLIQCSNSAVQMVMKLAAAMESPKAISTLNDLIGTNRDNILALQKMTKEERELDMDSRTVNIQNNYGVNPNHEEAQKNKLSGDLEDLPDESE